MKKARIGTLAASIAVMLVCGHAHAGNSLEVTMHKISSDGVGEKIGVIKIEKSQYGTLLTPQLKGLPAGPRGFHVHQNPDCGPGKKDGEVKAGLAAGGHLEGSHGKHAGPFTASGHLGDLPALVVEADGSATQPVLAPKITPEQMQGHALMIHAGGDTYSEPPELGGGGARIACGVIGKL